MVRTKQIDLTIGEIFNASDDEAKTLLNRWTGGDNVIEKAVAVAYEENKSSDERRTAVLSAVRTKLEGTPELESTALVSATSRMLNTIGAGLAFVLATLRYLGPLREDPRAIHPFASGIDPRDVGRKGEYTAAVLSHYGSEPVDFIHPEHLNGIPTKVSLSEAVRLWLRHFGIADAVSSSDAGKLGHYLRVTPNGMRNGLDLTNVGVGASQVLPILVMALISEPGAVLIFEQPELHVHPKVQSQLGDFFLAVMRTGRQCLVESHSEYLISRLRLRVAEASDDSDLGEKILFYFVERQGISSQFKKIDINPYGAIPEWPAGFFDQGPRESDAILAAATKKKRRLAQKAKAASQGETK